MEAITSASFFLPALAVGAYKKAGCSACAGTTYAPGDAATETSYGNHSMLALGRLWVGDCTLA